MILKVRNKMFQKQINQSIQMEVDRNKSDSCKINACLKTGAQFPRQPGKLPMIAFYSFKTGSIVVFWLTWHFKAIFCYKFVLYIFFNKNISCNTCVEFDEYLNV